MGIGYVEIVDKSLCAPCSIVKDRNTRRTPINPSTEGAVPALDFKYGSCIGSLCEYQKLFISGQFVFLFDSHNDMSALSLSENHVRDSLYLLS